MEHYPLLELQKLYQDRYVSYSDLEDFKTRYHLTSPRKSEIIKRALGYGTTFQFQALKTYLQTTHQLHKLLNCRSQLNQQFIKREQAKKYQIEDNSLDPQQIEAVVVTEDAELILAPAGSGKTASLLAKLNYLTDRLQIPAQDILVIAFTNKVVAELKERVKHTAVEIRTFHSLGNKIIKSNLPEYKLITESQTKTFFQAKIKSLYRSDPHYARLYDEYLGANDVTDDAATFLNLIIRPSNNPHAATQALESLFISVLGLQKSERISLAEFRRRLAQIQNPAARAKSLHFYQLYAPVAKAYADYLAKNHLYDFADMLNLATDLVTNLPQNSFNYQYILVDEAQDLSTAKYLLLKAILKKCRKVKLFAVGDDWQSIYRFAGSNLSVLDDFEKIFGRKTYRGLIELTYRFGQPTAKISNKFIQKNPHQSKKRVKPYVSRKTPIKIRLNTSDQSRQAPPDYHTVNLIIQELYIRYSSELFHKKIQIVSRYNRDVFRLVNENTKKHQNARLTAISEATAEFTWQLPNSTQKLIIPFCSMHKAKGITRDIIIIINANSGHHGIPSTRDNDPVAEVLLAELDDYPHAEERRLFYVAITRAKEKTFLVSDPYHISPFVFEINPRLTGTGVKVCPKCHRGIMQEKRRKDGKVYYSCSNFIGGCHHTET